MPALHRPIHVEDVAPETMNKRDGWAISEFRLPISGKDGSATTVFHSIFRPGSTHAKHLHSRCDEIAVYLEGHGLVGQGNERTEVRPGHCRLMPKGSEHFFFNETRDRDGLVVGFYVGAKSVQDTGYAYCGDVSEADRAMPRADALGQGILVHIDSVPRIDRKPPGWDGVEARFPIGSHNGSANALCWLEVQPGAQWPRHRHDRCEKVYYVVRGQGITGFGGERAAIRAGRVHLIAQGVEHFVYNSSRSEPLELIVVYTGAGSLDDSGYIGLGAANADELQAQPA